MSLADDGNCCSSYEINYLDILPSLFQLHVVNFYLRIASEPNRQQVFECIRDHMQPWHRIFIGVINPVDPRVETGEEVCERIMEALQYIPIEQLGTTDDCGFAPFDDDQSISRQIAFDKIRARIDGTRLAEERLTLQGRKFTQ